MIVHGLVCPIHGIPAIIGIGTFGFMNSYFHEISHYFMEMGYKHELADVCALITIGSVSATGALIFMIIMGWAVKKYKFCNDIK